jgi:hypothetical protein
MSSPSTSRKQGWLTVAGLLLVTVATGLGIGYGQREAQRLNLAQDQNEQGKLARQNSANTTGKVANASAVDAGEVILTKPRYAKPPEIFDPIAAMAARAASAPSSIAPAANAANAGKPVAIPIAPVGWAGTARCNKCGKATRVPNGRCAQLPLLPPIGESAAWCSAASKPKLLCNLTAKPLHGFSNSVTCYQGVLNLLGSSPM